MKKLTHRIQHSTNVGIFLLRNYYWLSRVVDFDQFTADDLTAKFYESKFNGASSTLDTCICISPRCGANVQCVVQHLQLVC